MIARTAPRPDSAGKQKGRPTTERPFANYINNGNDDPTEFDAQSQALASRFGFSSSLASTVLNLLRREVY